MSTNVVSGAYTGTADENSWITYVCQGSRTGADATVNWSTFKADSVLKYTAGFRQYASANAPNPANKSPAPASMQSYIICESAAGAIALTVSAATAYAVSTLSF